MGRSLLRPGVFAFNCRPFVIIATDSRPPCCISRFLPRRAPSLLQPPFVPPFPTLPLSIPFSPFSQPSLSLSRAFALALSLCLSFSLLSHPILPPTLYLSLPFFRRDNISLAIARSRLPSLVDEHADSLASKYLRVHHERSPRSPLSRSSSSPEDLFVLRGLRISFRHNGRLTDTRPLCLSLLDADGARERETGKETGKGKEREKLARSRVYGHTSEIAEVEESAFLVPFASTGNMAAPVAQLEQACARARRLQYH